MSHCDLRILCIPRALHCTSALRPRAVGAQGPALWADTHSAAQPRGSERPTPGETLVTNGLCLRCHGSELETLQLSQPGAGPLSASAGERVPRLRSPPHIPGASDPTRRPRVSWCKVGFRRQKRTVILTQARINLRRLILLKNCYLSEKLSFCCHCYREYFS